MLQQLHAGVWYTQWCCKTSQLLQGVQAPWGCSCREAEIDFAKVGQGFESGKGKAIVGASMRWLYDILFLTLCLVEDIQFHTVIASCARQFCSGTWHRDGRQCFFIIWVATFTSLPDFNRQTQMTLSPSEEVYWCPTWGTRAHHTSHYTSCITHTINEPKYHSTCSR